MKLYIFERDPNAVSYDEMNALVIAAENIDAANAIAAKIDERFVTEIFARKREIGVAHPEIEPGILLEDFNPG